MEYPVNNPNPIVPNPIIPIQPQQPPAPFAPSPIPPNPETKKGSNKSIVVVGIILIAVTAFAVTGYALNSKAEAEKANAAKIAKVESQLAKTETSLVSTQKELSKLQDTTGQSDVDPDLFQAVFFKDGNVYFGKITKLTDTTITLENIFYLNVSGGGAVDIDNLDSSSGKQVTLVKLGKELHGPEDVMYIERKEITFWENLKNDSKIVSAIKDYERENVGLPSSATYKLRSIISDLIFQQTINTSNE